MDSLHKRGGFKTIYMRRGAIEKKPFLFWIIRLPPPKEKVREKCKIQSTIESSIYIIITGVRLSICLYVRLCVPHLLPHFLTDYKNKSIYGFLAQRGRF